MGHAIGAIEQAAERKAPGRRAAVALAFRIEDAGAAERAGKLARSKTRGAAGFAGPGFNDEVHRRSLAVKPQRFEPRRICGKSAVCVVPAAVA